MCKENLKQYDGKLTEQFIQSLHDEGLVGEILREGSPLEDINNATSEWELSWA